MNGAKSYLIGLVVVVVVAIGAYALYSINLQH